MASSTDCSAAWRRCWSSSSSRSACCPACRASRTRLFACWRASATMSSASRFPVSRTSEETRCAVIKVSAPGCPSPALAAPGSRTHGGVGGRGARHSHPAVGIVPVSVGRFRGSLQGPGGASRVPAPAWGVRRQPERGLARWWCSRSENRGADPDHGRPFLDGHLEIVAHPHGQLIELQAATDRCRIGLAQLA